MKKKKNYALITGASQGLGKEIAMALARRQINVLLVALPGEGLAKTASEIQISLSRNQLWYLDSKLNSLKPGI